MRWRSCRTAGEPSSLAHECPPEGVSLQRVLKLDRATVYHRGMRWLLLLVTLLGVAACDSRYGTYLVVQGTPQLTFDRVEFFFGTMLDARMPTSPGHPVTVAAETGRVAKRLYVETDVQRAAGPVTSLNYYLIDTDDNRRLGEVVVAVAYLNDQPVGIAELDDFEIVTDDTYVLYELRLVPYASEDVERWGRPAPDCVRWARPGMDGALRTLAIVRGDDVDCDNFGDADVDCDPVRYCDGSGHGDCAGRAACILDAPSCQLGGCVNADGAAPRACTPTTCLPEATCETCAPTLPVIERVECALFNGPHDDYPITIRPDQRLCSEPYTFQIALADNVACTAPRLESSAEYQVSTPQFTYAVAQSGVNCSITITPKVAGTPYAAIAHLLISIDSPSGARVAFSVGVSAEVGACNPSEVVTIAQTLGTCP